MRLLSIFFLFLKSTSQPLSPHLSFHPVAPLGASAARRQHCPLFLHPDQESGCHSPVVCLHPFPLGKDHLCFMLSLFSCLVPQGLLMTSHEMLLV